MQSGNSNKVGDFLEFANDLEISSQQLKAMLVTKDNRVSVEPNKTEREKKLEQENKELKVQIALEAAKSNGDKHKEFMWAFKHHLMWQVAVYSEVAEGKVELKQSELLATAKNALHLTAVVSDNFWVRVGTTVIPWLVGRFISNKNISRYKKLTKFKNFNERHTEQEDFYNRTSGIVADCFQQQVSLMGEKDVDVFASFLIEKIVVDGILEYYNEDRREFVKRYISERRKDPLPYTREEAIYLSLATWDKSSKQLRLDSCGNNPARFAESMVTKCGIVDKGDRYKKSEEGYGDRLLFPDELVYCPNRKLLLLQDNVMGDLPYHGHGFYESKLEIKTTMDSKENISKIDKKVKPMQSASQQTSCCLVM